MANKELRQWWQRPRRASERPNSRSVSFLELFYDLMAGLLVPIYSRMLLAAVVFLLFLPIAVSLLTWMHAPSPTPPQHG